MCSSALVLLTIAIPALMITLAACIGIDGEVYPVVDKNGYYLAYKSDNTWINWWQMDKPPLATIATWWALAYDYSNVPTYNSVLAKKLPVRTPYWVDGAPTNSKDVCDNSDPGGGVRGTWIGHATVLAEVGGTTVITDPIFSDRASVVSFVGPMRYRPPACLVADLPDDLDAVVISHTHYDHLDSTSCENLHSRFGSQLHWFVPSGLRDWMTMLIGVDEANVHDMVWWQKKRHPITNATFVFTPSNHWGKRTPFDENHVLWGSWAVISGEDGGGRFWFGGDTAYCDAFKQIGKKLGPFDLAAIPIGAYGPRNAMKFNHANPDEAVQIHKDVRSKRSLGIHWGTFKLTYEYYLEPRSKLKQSAAEHGLDEGDFVAPDIGETVCGASETT